jgi:hypothetical protein
MDLRLDTGGWLTLTECVTALFPTRTFTLQDAPSFTRRDNDEFTFREPNTGSLFKSVNTLKGLWKMGAPGSWSM